MKKFNAGLCFTFLILISIFIMTTTVVYAATWDVQNDFSGISNPAGAWSYGWESVRGGAFNLYDTAGWHDSAISSWDNTPAVWKNLGGPVNGVQTGEVSLHPGQEGQFSVVRWTSPVTGTISITGKFDAGDPGGVMSYFIYDGANLLFEVHDSGSDATFILNEYNVSVGSTIDFMVGEHYWYGNTPLYATINSATSAPEPATLLLLGLGLVGLAGVKRKFNK